MRVLFDQIVMARKVYKCDASETWHNNSMSSIDCKTDDERLILDAAEADGWRILRGQKYRCVRGFDDDNNRFTSRARPGMDSLCQSHDLYDY